VGRASQVGRCWSSGVGGGWGGVVCVMDVFTLNEMRTQSKICILVDT
jgi:hypothetical protein